LYSRDLRYGIVNSQNGKGEGETDGDNTWVSADELWGDWDGLDLFTRKVATRTINPAKIAKTAILPHSCLVPAFIIP
jgi:hypothetical protein